MTTTILTAPERSGRSGGDTGRRGLRLTRRGRVTLVLVMLGLLLLTFGLGRATKSDAAPPATVHRTVVQPGETLWSVASRLDPHADVRRTVQQLRTLNHLAGAQVAAGQSLLLPS